MPKKIAPFALREPEVCVKCAADMPIGTEVTWLREAERKGYYHTACEPKPTIAALTKIRHKDISQPLGFRWVRQRDIPALAKATPVVIPQAIPAPTGTHDALLNALTDALMPQLMKKLAEVPRITVNIVMPKPGDAKDVLEMVGRELLSQAKESVA